MKGWIRKWSVPASAGGTWIVSLKHDGTYGCSCPVWKFAKAPKPDCHHIDFIKANPSYGEQSNKRIVLANVREVTESDNDVLLTPLVPFGDLHFSLTVACDLARLGATPEDLPKYLHRNRLRAAQSYISQNGRKIYGPWSDQRHRHEGYEIVPQTAHLPTDNAVQFHIQGRGAIRCSKRTATAALCLPTFPSFRCRSRSIYPMA